jgi:WD40 repeat protein
MWSFGCIVFEIFSPGRKRAFQNDFEVYQYGKDRKTPFNHAKQLDSIGKYYLQGLLECDPAKRPSSKSLLLTKFVFDGPSIPFENRPKKRKLADTDMQNTRLLGLVNETIKWSATNATQPQVFRSFIGNASETDVGEITFRRVRVGERVETRPQLGADANTLIRLMKNALVASDAAAIVAFAHTVSDHDLDETFIHSYVALWTNYRGRILQFQLRFPHSVQSEAIRRVAFAAPHSFDAPFWAIREYLGESESGAADSWQLLYAKYSSRNCFISRSHHLRDVGFSSGMHIGATGQLGITYHYLDVSIRVFETSTGAELPQFELKNTRALSHELWMSSDQWYYAVYQVPNILSIFRLTHDVSAVATKEMTIRCLGNEGPVLAVSRTGRYLAAVDSLGVLSLFDLETREIIFTDTNIDRFDFSVFAPLLFSQYGVYLAYWRARNIHILDTRTGLKTSPADNDLNDYRSFYSLAFRPDTNHLYAWKDGCVELVWNGDWTYNDTGQRLGINFGRIDEYGGVNGSRWVSIQFSPDGDFLVAIDIGRIRFYTLQSGRLQPEAIVLHRSAGLPSFGL